MVEWYSHFLCRLAIFPSIARNKIFLDLLTSLRSYSPCPWSWPHFGKNSRSVTQSTVRNTFGLDTLKEGTSSTWSKTVTSEAKWKRVPTPFLPGFLKIALKGLPFPSGIYGKVTDETNNNYLMRFRAQSPHQPLVNQCKIQLVHPWSGFEIQLDGFIWCEVCRTQNSPSRLVKSFWNWNQQHFHPTSYLVSSPLQRLRRRRSWTWMQHCGCVTTSHLVERTVTRIPKTITATPPAKNTQKWVNFPHVNHLTGFKEIDGEQPKLHITWKKQDTFQKFKDHTTIH